MSCCKKGIIGLLSSVVVLLAAAAIVHAHATILWCYVENDKVNVEAFFMGGAKVQNGTIRVLDKEGTKLLEGTTDKEGLFQFVPPVRDDMTIVLIVDNAHGADFELSRQDFLDAEQEAAAAK